MIAHVSGHFCLSIVFDITFVAGDPFAGSESSLSNVLFAAGWTCQTVNNAPGLTVDVPFDRYSLTGSVGSEVACLIYVGAMVAT